MTAKGGDDEVVRAWRDLLATKFAAWCALEHELQEFGLGVTEFEVLDRLHEKCGDEDFRVQELADSVYLSQSALSRLIGRLEKDGLVSRTLCAEDRRGIYVCLTEAGRDRYLEARPTHRAVLADTLKPGS
jgi:DNA-binding MarR family transcriptional regulator